MRSVSAATSSPSPSGTSISVRVFVSASRFGPLYVRQFVCPIRRRRNASSVVLEVAVGRVEVLIDVGPVRRPTSRPSRGVARSPPSRSAVRYRTSTSSMIHSPRATSPSATILDIERVGHRPFAEDCGVGQRVTVGKLADIPEGGSAVVTVEPEGHGDLQREREILRHRRRVPAHGRVALRRLRRGRVRDLPVALLAIPTRGRSVGRQPAR